MATQDPIRIMLVDDHAMVRSGLAAFLLIFDDLSLVAEAAHGIEALRLIEETRPDVILMDMVMPEMDGAATTRLIKERFPEIQVLALTSFKEDHLVHQALEAGATGFLLKNISADQLAAAIRDAYAGRPTLAPEATQALIRATRAANQPTPLVEPLTEREQEVLALMVGGLSNAAIAEQLVVSLSTVKFHVSNILAKLAAESRTEAVSMALQKGLVK
jgi:NarL family two-component system response regulator LiaR